MAVPKELFERYIRNQCSEAEVEELMAYFHTEHLEELNRLVLEQIEYQGNEESGKHAALLQEVKENLNREIHKTRTKFRISRPARWAVAASLLLCSGLGVYLGVFKHPSPYVAVVQTHDVAPGKNQATLTLANGQKIILTKSLAGTVARQGSVTIGVGTDSTLAYRDSKNAATKVEYNTLSTARGEKSPFPLYLSDGTKVWLNAASSIKFPAAFPAGDRRVEITGEVYMEVKHDAKRKFEVIVGNQLIQDIGTHFNINAYTDEPLMKTTLLQGSIRIKNKRIERILKPGQQAVTQQGKDTIQIKNGINPAYITAWKDDYFRFDDESLPAIMRQFARWYDIEIEYSGKMREHEFVGKIPRNSTLSQVLNVLALGGIHYRIDGKKLIIQP